MSDSTIYNSIEERMKNIFKKQKEKIGNLKLEEEKINSINLSEIDAKEIPKLKNDWQELMLDTERLRLEYDLLIREMKEVKQFSINLQCGTTWKYKLAKWLIK